MYVNYLIYTESILAVCGICLYFFRIQLIEYIFHLYITYGNIMKYVRMVTIAPSECELSPYI